jgi:hypothetical protein
VSVVLDVLLCALQHTVTCVASELGLRLQLRLLLLLP